MLIITPLWVIAIVISFLFPEGNEYLNYSMLTLWAITVLLLFKKDSKFSIASLFFIVSFTVAALSCVVAESGSFFSEIKQASYLTGAVARNISLCAILLLISFWTHKVLETVTLLKFGFSYSLNMVFRRIILISVLISIAVLIGVHIKYGSPNDYNVDRFYYWNNIAPAWGNYFKFLLMQMTIFLGLFYAFEKKRIYIFIFVGSLVSQVLVGEKLTGLYIAVIFFLIPVVVVRNLSLIKLLLQPRSLIILSFGLVILFFIVLASYNSLSGNREGLELFLNRIVLQSQMWWAVDNISDQAVSSSDIIRHMLGFTATSDADTGIYYLMSQITDPKTFYWFYDKGITFTMASPANFIYFFGPYWCYLAIVPVGIILGFSIHILVKSIQIKDLILIVFTLKFFYMVIRVVTMAEIHLIFDYKFVIIVLVLLFYMLYGRKRNDVHA